MGSPYLYLHLPLSIQKLQNSFREFDISGDYVFVSYYYSLLIGDISTPASPPFVSNTPFTGAMWGDGDLAVVNNYMYGFKVYDISDPFLPVELSHVEIASQYYPVLQDTLLVANHSDIDEIRLYSLADPATPALLATLSQDNLAGDLILFGNTLLIAADNSALTRTSSHHRRALSADVLTRSIRCRE